LAADKEITQMESVRPLIRNGIKWSQFASDKQKAESLSVFE
jgi:hypothetical protein